MNTNRGSPSARASPYQGEDRRRRGGRGTAGLGLPFTLAIAGLGVLLLLLALGPLGTDGVGILNVDLLRVQLQAAAVAVALLAGTLCLVQWRATGEAAAMWLGAALLFFGLTTVGLGTLLPQISPAGFNHDVLTWAHPASRLTVLWLLYRALRTPEVDAGLRLWPVLVAAIGLKQTFTGQTLCDPDHPIALESITFPKPVVSSGEMVLASSISRAR